MHQYKGLLGDTKHNLSVTNRALGRVIAKLDPIYHISEFDPARKAESDKIADKVLKKMSGEVFESNKYGG